MAFPGTLVAFVASTNLEVSRRFYRDSLGLPITSSSLYADAYAAGGTELRVTLVTDKASAPYTVLGWEVADLDSAVEQLKAAGVAFTSYDGLEQDDHLAWRAPDGTRVAWFRDPDDNVLSIHEFA